MVNFRMLNRNHMRRIPGSIKVACTSTLKEELKNIGEESCILIIDAIKNIDGVIDVWFTDNKKYDIIVEIEVDNLEQSKQIESKIKEIDGVDKNTILTSVALMA